MALVNEALEGVQEFLDIMKVESCSWLIKYEEPGGSVTALYVSGEL